MSIDSIGRKLFSSESQYNMHALSSEIFILRKSKGTRKQKETLFIRDHENTEKEHSHHSHIIQVPYYEGLGAYKLWIMDLKRTLYVPGDHRNALKSITPLHLTHKYQRVSKEWINIFFDKQIFQCLSTSLSTQHKTQPWSFLPSITHRFLPIWSVVCLTFVGAQKHPSWSFFSTHKIFIPIKNHLPPISCCTNHNPNHKLQAQFHLWGWMGWFWPRAVRKWRRGG